MMKPKCYVYINGVFQVGVPEDLDFAQAQTWAEMNSTPGDSLMIQYYWESPEEVE